MPKNRFGPAARRCGCANGRLGGIGGRRRPRRPRGPRLALLHRRWGRRFGTGPCCPTTLVRSSAPAARFVVGSASAGPMPGALRRPACAQLSASRGAGAASAERAVDRHRELRRDLGVELVQARGHPALLLL